MTDDDWPTITWRDRLAAARSRVAWWLWSARHPVRRWGPRCGAIPPWRLADAGRCCIYHGHTDERDREDWSWHADGEGYIWSDELGQWAWRGPVINLDDYDWGTYPYDAAHEALFTEPDLIVRDRHAVATEPCAHDSERPGWGGAGPTYVCLTCGRVRAHDEPSWPAP